MFKYLKFSAAPLTILIAIYFSFLGGNYTWYFFLGFYAFVMIGDLIGGNDITVEEYKYPFFLNLMLYLTLPLLIVLLSVMIYKIDEQTVSSFIGYCVQLDLCLVLLLLM